MSARLDDLPLHELKAALRATERCAGADSASASLLRKAIARKEATARPGRGVERLCNRLAGGREVHVHA